MHRGNARISVITIISNRTTPNTIHLIRIQRTQCNWMQLDYYPPRECADSRTIYVFTVENQDTSRMSAWKRPRLLPPEEEAADHQRIEEHRVIEGHIKEHLVKDYNTTVQSTGSKLQSHQNLQCRDQPPPYQHPRNRQSEI